MSTFTDKVRFYNDRFNAQTSFFPEVEAVQHLKVSIVIPSYDEDLEEVFRSLGENSIPNAQEIEVILILNHSETSEIKVKEKHADQAALYDKVELSNGIPVFVISAFDLPQKKAGVGLARKIGMDVALNRFAKVNHDGLIVCLDGDCTVSINYINEILRAEKASLNGLSICFEHNIEKLNNEDVIKVIDYEIFLRYYIHALRSAGYPHAFHTIGSSMASRASAYAKIGGMNTRKAGEDFYFLHKLIPQGQFFDLTNATVYPSSRKSTRVPFGTGRAMLEMEAGTKDFDTLYHPHIFRDLREVFNRDGHKYSNFEKELPESFYKYLVEFKLLTQLQNLQQRSSGQHQFHKNFIHWMDGFKLLKFVHYCRDHMYPNLNVEEACSQLFNIDKPDRREEVLYELRKMDRESTFSYF